MSQQNFAPFEQARQLLGQKRYREAHALCRKAIEQNPDSPDAFYVLGIISYEHHDYPRALKLFEAAIQAGHPEPAPRVQAARCLALLNLPKQALEHIEAAKRLNPTDAFTLASIGATLSRLDCHEEAVSFHRKATQVAPNDVISFRNLGSSLQFLGDFEGARDAYETALRLAPGYSSALAHLSLINQQTSEQNDLKRLQNAWQKRHPQDVEGGLHLAHAIAKVYEDLGDPDAAMDWLAKGKALGLQLVPERTAHDSAAYQAAKALSRDLKQTTATDPTGPVFIVGLPRTGTTLVDRIITSHSQITSAGERSDFAACLHRAAGIPGSDMLDPRIMSKTSTMDLSGVGADYLANVSAILGSPQRFTDKMPINAFFVPAILAALPSARVICLRRHPADSVLSMYRQFFTVSSVHYRCTYDLEQLAEYVASFHDLVETYLQTLPETRFTVLDYESLVAAPETETGRLLAFCGLGFEPACLDFQNNAAPVATASVAQVRKPIFTSSKGRWTRYREHLEPALKILIARGLMQATD